MPVALPGAHDLRRIFSFPEAAVVAAQRAVEVAVLHVQVMAQDDAAVAQVGAQMEQVVVAPPDERDPERHHLHESAGARAGNRVLAEIALDLDQAEHELRIEASPLRLVMDRHQEFLALEAIDHARSEPLRHGGEPEPRLRFRGEREERNGMIGDGLVERGAHARRQRLIDLRSGVDHPRRRQEERQRQRVNTAD
jgi:hypothetical protein